ncbi:SDR family oxidoreductase [Kitasatospora sp. NBC_01287]|uniref:SDR family oxidoreductase n=1 Tax=Kitasatospora sp. NBC_01287 TaxID=2903573 RepID=UPI0022540641|nr:SDR family oxidoreductase [Kitasatospora sp. NBC_01287]MCX4748672.1 SDR family oxidoreductase [Kitasatospora sp. NBC_01287]
MSLNGKRVVLIGGTSGIGFAAAKLAAAEGASVVVASSKQDRVDDAVKQLGGDAEGYRLDVTDEAQISEFFTRVGEFDHLVYTAGDALLMKALAEVTVAEAKAFFDIRYWGAFLSAKHGAPGIRPGGSIVVSSGSVATRPAPGTSVAASSTAAAESLARALAVELGPAVRVNAVRPGPAKTAMWDASVPNAQDIYDTFGPHLLTKRVAEATEVAEAYIYLLNNTFTTGTVLTVDGGHVLV